MAIIQTLQHNNNCLTFAQTSSLYIFFNTMSMITIQTNGRIAKNAITLLPNKSTGSFAKIAKAESMCLLCYVEVLACDRV